MCERVTVRRPAGQWSYSRAGGVSFGCVALLDFFKGRGIETHKKVQHCRVCAVGTCSRFPERDSSSLRVLSLQVVAKRLPSVLNDMERTTSVWWLIVRTGFFMTASGQSKFQIITCTFRVTHDEHTHTRTSSDSNHHLDPAVVLLGFCLHAVGRIKPPLGLFVLFTCHTC